MTEWLPHRLVDVVPAERRELLRLVKRGRGSGDAKVIEAFLPTEDEGVYEVVPGPFVGRFALQSGRVLDVGSRLLSTGELSDVLRISGHLPARLDETLIPAQPGWGVIDVIALALAAETERLVGHGIAKAYRQRRFRSPPLPGTIDMREHLSRHAARPDKLVTVARRLTSDIDRNQAIAAATAVLLRLPLQPLARLRLRRVAAALSTVSTPIMSPAVIEQLIGQPRQGRYRAALRLSALVLCGSTVASAGEQVTGASVLFAMPKVWEDFVLAWVAQTHPGRRICRQYRFPLIDGRPSPVASADVVVLDDRNDPAELYDAKYKAAGPTPSANDIYQMVTYCERLGLDEATLVHPGSARRTEVSVGDRRIHTLLLNAAAMAS